MVHGTHSMARHLRAFFFSLLAILLFQASSIAQEHSIAREWNEELLESIREDFARPTVHARNLWHSSFMMYDIWATYTGEGDTFFLGKTVGDYECAFEGVPAPENADAAIEEAISYAMYRLILHRFQNAPGIADIFTAINTRMDELGYDETITSIDYQDGTPAHFGNYIAQEVINFGFTDGSNEIAGYTNTYYSPINEPLDMGASGNPDMLDPNHWQPLVVEGAIDQAGNPIDPIVEFLSPEWGDAVSFSLTPADETQYELDGNTWRVFKDPGAPPYLAEGSGEGLESLWKWGHVMVAIWQGHHDKNDGVIWDISPNGIGNNPPLPTSFDDYDQFYDFYNGGDASQGYTVNPITGEPYEPQLVPRADYARVLAEFWADGPDSETPPGHWFTILHEVNDHPMLNKRWNGQGPILDDLEWDIKSQFLLGCTMHDAAICAWSVKGYYDYARPVSAIRYMAEKGQCTDELLPNYHPDGFPLIPGHVELVEVGDPLAGDMNENVNEIKLFTWRGPDYIEFEEGDEGGIGLNEAGVGWILAKDWWPYQRPTFVTPPFAGYVSGHSTFSRAAAEVMTLMTGSEYFPGGKSGFSAPQNEFLVFEEGPSTDVILEWATYRDASDQCSLSRIWGGIHPPADDIPGRLIGMELGPQVYEHAITYFEDPSPRVSELMISDALINDALDGATFTISVTYDQNMDMMSTPILDMPFDDPIGTTLTATSEGWNDATSYSWDFTVADMNMNMDDLAVEVTGALNTEGFLQNPFIEIDAFVIDTRNPAISTEPMLMMINDATAEAGTVSYQFGFDEMMDTETTPSLTWSMGDPSATLSLSAASAWLDEMTYEAVFDVSDANIEQAGLVVELNDAMDANGNMQVSYQSIETLAIDTRNPEVTANTVSAPVINDMIVSGGTYEITIEFDETMNMMMDPQMMFPMDDPSNTITLDSDASGWDMDGLVYTAVFTLADANETLNDISVEAMSAMDANGNEQVVYNVNELFQVDTENPALSAASGDVAVVSDSEAGLAGLFLTLTFSEAMDTEMDPMIAFSEDVSGTLTLNAMQSMWADDMTYEAVYDVADENIEINDIDVDVTGTADGNGNMQMAMDASEVVSIDTRNPEAQFLTANDYLVTPDDEGAENFSLIIIFDEAMDTNLDPFVLFPTENPGDAITANAGASGWINNSTYEAVFDVAGDESTVEEEDVDVVITSALDEHGNLLVQADYPDFFDIDMNPVGMEEFISNEFGLYPNPIIAGQNLMLRSAHMNELDAVTIFDLKGRIITSIESIPAVQGTLELPTSQLAGGFYLLEINVNGEKKSFRFQVIG